MKISLLLLIIFSGCLFYEISSIKPTTCGAFTPAQWFNLDTNDQVTLEFGVISLNSDIVIPYLYGCRPKMASSPTQNISFQYNTAGLVTSNTSPSAKVTLTYFTEGSEYFFFSVTFVTDTAVTLNTFTDSDLRIVTIETSAYYQGNQIPRIHKRDLIGDNSGGLLKRNILAPLGDMNYYYQGPYEFLASTLNVAWNGIEQVTYQYSYTFDVSNNRVGTNVTTALFQESPFYINYEYHYNNNGQIDYYCVNSCNSAKVTFGYDSMGRLVNSTNGQDILLSIQYDNNGNAVVVKFGGTIWNLSY